MLIMDYMNDVVGEGGYITLMRTFYFSAQCPTSLAHLKKRCCCLFVLHPSNDMKFGA